MAPKRGCLCPGPWCVGCGTRCAQTVLAPKMAWTGPGHSPARRRQEAFLSCPAGLIGHPGFWGFRCLERRGTTRRSSPTGSWCLCVGAGLGARPSFLFSCGVSPPHDEAILFRQKDPKPVAPGRGPQRGCLCPGPAGARRRHLPLLSSLYVFSHSLTESQA